MCACSANNKTLLYVTKYKNRYQVFTKIELNCVFLNIKTNQIIVHDPIQVYPYLWQEFHVNLVKRKGRDSVTN